MTPRTTLFVEHDPERLLDGLRGDGRFTWGCAHKRVNDKDPVLGDDLKDPYPQAVLKRFDDGKAFEAHVFSMMANNDDVICVDGPGDTQQQRADHIQRTFTAISERKTVILGGSLPTTSKRSLKPDILIRHDVDGHTFYLPADVKGHSGMTGDAQSRQWLCSSLTDTQFACAESVDMGRGKPHLKDSLQLAHYWTVLSELGIAPPVRPVGAIVGKELNLVWRYLDEPLWRHPHPSTGETAIRSALEIYQLEWEFRWSAIQNMLLRNAGEGVELLTGPEWKSECQECPWRTVCHEDLKATNHVTLLAGVTPTVSRQLASVGVTTIAELARLDTATASIVAAGIPVATLRQLCTPCCGTTHVREITTAATVRKLETHGISTCGQLASLDPFTSRMPAIAGLVRLIDTARARLAGTNGKVLLARGVTQLSLPRADIEVDVDMENDPAGDPALVYLWGTWTAIRVKDMKLPGANYRAFATWNRGDVTGEAEAFAGLWRYLHSLINLADTLGLSFKAYCYTDAEARCMRSLSRRHHGSHPGVPSLTEVETFLGGDHWVDMAKAVKSDLVWPTEDHKLKSVAKWARHQWRADDASGDNSTVWYHTAVNSQDDGQREAAVDKLLAYNEDDVKATMVLRNWLTDSATRLPGAEQLDAGYRRRRIRR